MSLKNSILWSHRSIISISIISLFLDEEIDNVEDQEEAESDGDEEAGDDLNGLDGAHTPVHGHHKKEEAVLEEGKEDGDEACKHPDVDVGGIGD